MVDPSLETLVGSKISNFQVQDCSCSGCLRKEIRKSVVCEHLGRHINHHLIPIMYKILGVDSLGTQAPRLITALWWLRRCMGLVSNDSASAVLWLHLDGTR